MTNDEGSDVKEWMQMMLSDQQIQPCDKSQIDKLYPTEVELLIIIRKDNLSIKLYKELLEVRFFFSNLSDSS
jgi:uncharacterized protein YecA (UPF0149 family)